MNGFVVFVLMALASAAAAQNAQILSDARYLSNNGQFGSAYTQGDGVEFKEEADAEGNRRGSYSYVDPSGQRRSISYTAGKDGFKATGDHLPVAPTPVPVPAVPAVPAAAAAAPSARWQDQWSQAPAVPQWNQWNSAPAPVVASDKSDDGQWRAEYDDAGKYDNGQWNAGSSNDDGSSQRWNQWNAATAAPAVPMAKQAWNQWNVAPAPAAAAASSQHDDGQWRAEYDDSGKYDDGQWNAGSGQQWNQWNAATAAPAVPMAKQAWNQWNSIPTTAKWNQWEAAAPTAPPASYSVNQASGKFNLNRSPDGFSYSYSQN